MEPEQRWEKQEDDPEQRNEGPQSSQWREVPWWSLGGEAGGTRLRHSRRPSVTLKAWRATVKQLSNVTEVEAWVWQNRLETL